MELLLTLALAAAPTATARAPAPADTLRDRLLSAARTIIAGARYAALVTVDATGAPQARTVDPLAPDSAMVVWIGTNPRSRKVAEIRREPRVALHWLDPNVGGYVTLRGTARLVDDPEEKARRWRPGWEAFYPDRRRDLLLIQVHPSRLEVVW
jgi:general stress protein 26